MEGRVSSKAVFEGAAGIGLGEPTRSAESLLAAFLPSGETPALTRAFTRRAPLFIHGRGGKDLDPALFPKTLDALISSPRQGATIAYVHVPFCHNHCLFCGFYQNPYVDSRSGPFVDLLLKEVEQTSQASLVRDGPPIEALYLGGGTPTALAAADLFRLIEGLRRHLPLATDCEITLEGRLYEFALDKARAAIAAGVNRISLGVQSFDTKVRRRLGRKLARPDLLEATEKLVALDEATIVIDLMYGLPGQSPEVWQADLNDAASLGLDGIDYYALNIWPGGPLAQSIAVGKAPRVPTLAEQAEAYGTAREFFGAKDWTRLSQAHAARTARERNVYNQLNKGGVTCLAFGPSAGGTGHGFLWRNEPNLERWAKRVEAGEYAIAGIRRLDAGFQSRAQIVASLEAGRIDVDQIEKVSPGFINLSREVFDAWECAGLLQRNGGSFEMTIAGDFWMNTLSAGLAAVLEHLGHQRFSESREDLDSL